ncbi:HupE/UreJ family protein [Primorskyibacter aestuariivivens]|uniref:HupE/UreJ family protein n=1 Tax=Primorskyibacter aestuariivivens TaxID=1888912 RepID=UPI0023006DCF|nr:HupE/UreJ family protein [Primorskyibacter aestuariivivens]MDA7428907.1 HupE/UreJ family protein [Primorskyibacter aestuariivivens]
MRWLVSIMAMVWGLAATAHEVMPTIGDLTVTDGQAELVLRLNAEAFAAGIDLDGLEDTNATDQSSAYDALRALPPEELQARMAPVAAQMADSIGLTSGGTAVPLNVARIEIGPLGNIDLARESEIAFSAALQDATAPLVLSWPDGYGTLVLRQQGVETPYTGYLDGGQSSDPILPGGAEPKSGWQVFAEYIPVGFDHIVPKGLDHILFVLGLFFLSTKLGPLLWQVTAFTAAHTVTLALGALGVVNIPGSIVEPIIAASIVYVAVENILSPKMHAWRPVVVFCFGLLHGLGFASVLGEFGLPAGQFIPALLGFNVGVEVGQLTVIAVAFLAVGLWFGRKSFYRPYIAVPASVVIALVGAYWFVERVFL